MAKRNPITDFIITMLYPIWAVLDSVLIRIALKIFCNFFSKAKIYGQIIMKFPEFSEPKVFGDKNSHRKVHINIKNTNEFLWRCVTQGDIGFAEGYMDGLFECDNITMFLQILVANRPYMNNLDTFSAWMSHVLDRMSHLRRANTVEGSSKNIRDHYDLGNDMFELFLDPTMMYSCAYWKHPSETLQQAQINKLHEIIKKADIQKGDHVLEIGSGWGAMAMEAVKMTGCKVTTITLSQEQKALAEERIREAGLQDSIEVVLRDYRHMKGQFDRIISIEMLEAVGLEYMPGYFEICSKLLKPGGKMVFQVITYPNKGFENYAKGCDFIQKHIFPGGICPSVNAVLDAVEAKSDLKVELMHNIGYDYARTLKEWRYRFMKSKQAILNLGYDEEFIRKWEYYFCYCEAGFEMEFLGDYQIVLAHPRYKSEVL